MVECDLKTWQDYVPERVWLHEIDRGDSLDGCVQEIQECLSDNSDAALVEKIDEWWDFPESYYLDEIKKEMEADGLGEKFEEHSEEIRELLWERDESTPLDDLLRVSGPFPMFYSLGESFSDLWVYDHYDEEQENEDVECICNLLHISTDSPLAEKVRDIRQNANYGGELRIYFHTDLRKMLTYDSSKDFKAIRFKGKFLVALWNVYCGSGYEEEIELDLTVEFERRNLFHAEYESNDIISVCGMCRSAIPETDPEMLMEMTDAATEVKLSSTQDYMEREAHLTAVFKAGQCTLGDMNLNRHRDVYYRNDYPCGLKCPHCGTFWID